MNKGDFTQVIQELEEDGVIKTEKTRDGEKVSFTEEGLKATELAIGMRTDMQLFLFQIIWENEYSDMENGVEKLIKVAEDMRDGVGVNILRTLEFEEDKLHGIEIKEELPESLLRHFDPE